MIKISPQKIKGQWVEGYALDIHTVSSEPIGYDEYGHLRFDNKYSPLGELLYRLKSKKDKSVIEAIVRTAADFVRSKSWPVDLVVSVPPSSSRSFQPVVVLAGQLAKVLSVGYCGNCVKKVKDTPQLKNVFDVNERKKLLSGAFQVDRSKIEGKSVLLFDDLYRSGATINEVSSALQSLGRATRVYAMTLTKTRVHR